MWQISKIHPSTKSAKKKKKKKKKIPGQYPNIIQFFLNLGSFPK
jgi:hypothetical protein